MENTVNHTRKALRVIFLTEFFLISLLVSLSGCGAVGSSNANSSTSGGGTPPPTPVISLTLATAPPTTMNAGAAAPVAATVSNDSANAGVDWSCTPLASCGSFNPAHTASGASSTYTAPAAAASVVITATSTSNHAATATGNVAVAAVATVGSAETLSAGQFVFLARGETLNTGTYGIAGTVVLDANGNVTGGEQNYVSVGGANSPEPGGDTITGGKLTTATNGTASLTVITNNIAVGVSGTETFSIAIANSKHALIEEFDASATSSGTLDFQTLTPGGLPEINGPYVWFVRGKRGTLDEVFGGLLTADGAGNANIVVDVNDDGAGEHGGTNIATYTAPDANGRGTITTPADTLLVYYVVNSKTFRLVTFDAGWADVGSMYAGATGVSNATLNQKFLFADSSSFSMDATYAAAGQMTFDGNGIISGFADVDENGHATSAAFTGTYTMGTNGYGTITITPGNTQDVSALGLYLADPTINFADPNSSASAGGGLRGVIIDLDTKVVGSGLLIVPGSATAAPSGNFAQQLQASNTNKEVDAAGVASATASAIAGTENLNNLLNTGLATALTSTATLTPDAANAGRFLSQISLASTPAQTLNLVLYQVSSTQFLLLEVDTPQFGAGILEQQQ